MNSRIIANTRTPRTIDHGALSKILTCSSNKSATGYNLSSSATILSGKKSANKICLSKKTKLQLNPARSIQECPMGYLCSNYKQMKVAELEMQRLIEANEQLKKINEFLTFALSQKEEMYLKLSNENSRMKKKITLFSRHVSSRNKFMSRDKEYSNKKEEEELNTLNTNFANMGDNTIPIVRRESKSLTERSVRRKGRKSKTVQIFSEEKSSTLYEEKIPDITPELHYINSHQALCKRRTADSEKLLSITKDHGPVIPPLAFSNRQSVRTHIQQDKKVKAIFHYDNVNEISQRNRDRKYHHDRRTSFLSVNDEALLRLASNCLIRELFVVTLSDDNFLETMRNASDDKLISYCDSIGNMIKDYKQSLKLIQRVKKFLKASINLTNSVLIDNTAQILLQNSCQIMDCERASLFVHDEITDMLVVHSGEGLTKNEVQIPKNSGIVGLVFTSGKKIKVDDAYSDERFNKEIDKATNFKTKNILCLPLKDTDGDIFGAIQAINKKGSSFDCDDEEFMEIFAQQASAILKNAMSKDESVLQISRLKMLVNYTIDVETIIHGYQFIKRTEELLMSLFSGSKSQFLLHQNGFLVHVDKYRNEQMKKVGIIDLVLNSKCFHGCSSIEECIYYNNLSDLDGTLSMITFPIMHETELLAVAQTLYSCKLTKSEKPKEFECNMIDYFTKIVSSWIIKKRNYF